MPGGYHFSFMRDLGRTTLVVLDCRNGRDLEPGARRMIGADEWAWITEQCHRDADHLLIATSLPVYVPGGLHGLQQWNEALCEGAWGRPIAWLSERLRRALDLEDWPAFNTSFHEFNDLVVEVATRERPPATITVLSGDIHFSYLSKVELTGVGTGGGTARRSGTGHRSAPGGQLTGPQRPAAEGSHRAALRGVTCRALDRWTAPAVGRSQFGPSHMGLRRWAVVPQRHG